MDDKLIEKKDEQLAKPKKEYRPPELTRYGKLTELTASGTAGQTETNPSGQPNKMT